MNNWMDLIIPAIVVMIWLARFVVRGMEKEGQAPRGARGAQEPGGRRRERQQELDRFLEDLGVKRKDDRRAQGRGGPTGRQQGPTTRSAATRERSGKRVVMAESTKQRPGDRSSSGTDSRKGRELRSNLPSKQTPEVIVEEIETVIIEESPDRKRQPYAANVPPGLPIASQDQLRQAFILSEALGKPLALRD
ncbi:hypothetical protein Pan216_06060 [Planctomycetes bacterium Pan216]|uniref:Uncharacterized protein n=1 Tax=Kolteria novifilia TaxID=2527975 RepID=A0A518AYI0_9BACT|nr:hypothetical protein Pan216_06060 [Planctomycetes bacterium Pan216]